jgi:hypothetical protein
LIRIFPKLQRKFYFRKIGEYQIDPDYQISHAGKKTRVLKGPADYGPASNSYPVKTLHRVDDALGPSELVNLLGIRFAY